MLKKYWYVDFFVRYYLYGKFNYRIRYCLQRMKKKLLKIVVLFMLLSIVAMVKSNDVFYYLVYVWQRIDRCPPWCGKFGSIKKYKNIASSTSYMYLNWMLIAIILSLMFFTETRMVAFSSMGDSSYPDYVDKDNITSTVPSRVLCPNGNYFIVL